MPIDIDTDNPTNEFLPPPILPNVINQPRSSDAVESENHYQQNLQMQPINLLEDSKSKLRLELTPCMQIASECADIETDEYLLPATEVQNMSCLTPDDCQNSISRINYDIDFSDISADNSIAEDLTPDTRRSPSFTPDPFSPIGSSCTITQTPLVPSNVSLGESNFPQQPAKAKEFVLPFLEETTKEETILDKKEQTPIDELPSPLKPSTSGYTGFSKQGWQIPSIPCNTGDYNSLNLDQSQPAAHSSMIESMHSDDGNEKDPNKSGDKVLKC